MLDTPSNNELPLDTVLGVSKEEYRRMKKWLDEQIASSKAKPSAHVITLSPCLASLLLERNEVNRPIGRSNHANLQEDLANKRWEFNGESIVVSNRGLLLDGQHRCSIVKATGVSIETVIVFGPRDEARYTIDIGSPKSASNFLHMMGQTDTNNVAAAISLLLQYRKHGKLAVSSLQRPTKTEIVQSLDKFKGIQASVDFVRGATKKKLGSRSVLAFCHYTFWKKSSREVADEFMSRLIEGESLRRGSAIYYCREKLLGLGRETRADSRAEVIFKSWNAWRRNENITRVNLKGTLPKVER